QLRPRLFPDFDGFRGGLKPQRTAPSQPKAYSPEQLQSFLRRARQPAIAREVTRVRAGRKQTFAQSVAKSPATPIDRLFLLLALTGLRLGEALSLRWEQVDIERGRI